MKSNNFKKYLIFLCIVLVVTIPLFSIYKFFVYNINSDTSKNVSEILDLFKNVPIEHKVVMTTFAIGVLIHGTIFEVIISTLQEVYFFVYSIFYNHPQFTRQISNDTFYRILVKDVPKNDLDRSKMMIAYFDSAGFSDVSRVDEVYIMKFHKLNYKTSDGGYKAEYDLGGVSMVRCKNTAGWKIQFSLSTSAMRQYEDGPMPITEDTMLLDECGCEFDWWEDNKNEELVKYYAELRSKK